MALVMRMLFKHCFSILVFVFVIKAKPNDAAIRKCQPNTSIELDIGGVLQKNKCFKHGRSICDYLPIYNQDKLQCRKCCEAPTTKGKTSAASTPSPKASSSTPATTAPTTKGKTSAASTPSPKASSSMPATTEGKSGNPPKTGKEAEKGKVRKDGLCPEVWKYSSIGLIVAVIILASRKIFKLNKKLKEANEKLKEANEKLKEANEKLKEANEKLEEAKEPVPQQDTQPHDTHNQSGNQEAVQLKSEGSDLIPLEKIVVLSRS